MEYDLIFEKWIPIKWRKGGYENIGLRQALERAHEIEEVYIDSPLETISVYRLLLAISIEAFPETGQREGWWRLWNQGGFDASCLADYFLQRTNCFDLLRKENPFYQDGSIGQATKKKSESKQEEETEKTTKRKAKPRKEEEAEDLKIAPISKLFEAESSGSNATLFDHNLDDAVRELTLDRAALGIICTQAWARFDGQSQQIEGEDRTGAKKMAPLMDKSVFWIRGNSLFEALLLNAPPLPIRMHSSDEDLPAWNPNAQQRSGSQPKLGILNYLTWQSRRILLVTRPSKGRGVKLSQGASLEPFPSDDQTLAYRPDKQGKLLPYRMTRNRALWRDVTSFLSLFDEKVGGGPRTFQWLNSNRELRREGKQWEVDVFCARTLSAKQTGTVGFWRHERFPVHLDLLNDADRRAALGVALNQCKRYEQRLYSATCELAAYLLFNTPFKNLKKKNKADAQAFALALDAENPYWSSLEVPFYELMSNLAEAEEFTPILMKWKRIARGRAIEAFQSATSSMNSDARHLKAKMKGKLQLDGSKK